MGHPSKPRDAVRADATVIIPARWASSRFPGKPLALINGVSMIERVWRRASQAVGPDRVCVATDDARIADAVAAFGGRAVMTSPEHRSGTDRCREAFDILGRPTPLVVNVQGDEPFVSPDQIGQIVSILHGSGAHIATLARPFPAGTTYDDLADPNVVKALYNPIDGTAIYFSRLPVPYLRNIKPVLWPAQNIHRIHVGMYGFTADALEKATSLPQSQLELAESLEQLRWLEAGMTIKVGETLDPTIGIDTPADLAAAEAFAQKAENP